MIRFRRPAPQAGCRALKSWRDGHSDLELPRPEDPRLAFFVREAWPSAATGTSITEGLLDRGEALTITSELGDGAVVFGDGIETDRIHIDWGQAVTVAAADRTLHLVR